MPDPELPGLHAVVPGEQDAARDPSQFRRFLIDVLGAPEDFAGHVIGAAANRGRPAFRLIGVDRERWEEKLAFTLVLLGVGGAMEAEATNAELDHLVKELEGTAQVIQRSVFWGGNLIDLRMRLLLEAKQLRGAQRRGRGQRINHAQLRADAALLELYRSAFGRKPGTDLSGPAARFIKAAWDIVVDDCCIDQARKKKIGTSEAALKRVIRFLEKLGKARRTPPGEE